METNRTLRVAYLGSSASPHNRRWTQYLSTRFELRMFSLEPESIPGVEVHHFRRRAGTGLDYLLSARSIAREITAFEPDLIHAHRITSYGYIATVAMRVASTPAIVSVWGEDVFSFPRRSPLHRWFTRHVLDQADQVLSTSHIMKQETLQYVSPRHEIQVTPFGVDTARFTPRDRALASVAGPATVSVVTVKKLRPRYGVDILIRAWAEARRMVDSEIDLELKIIGDGPQKSELIELAHDLGCGDAVTFEGRIPHEDVPEALSRADIFAALSVTNDESFGVAMIEASAAGLPVVSTHVGGIPEVVKDGETGILVAPGDVSAAAEAIAHLARNHDERHWMGRAGRSFVVENYDWNASAERMADIYREVANRAE